MLLILSFWAALFVGICIAGYFTTPCSCPTCKEDPYVH